uniref:Uncharacterized protein n=1 Tax=Magallana gigas TaxID=29159 RepID=A0A8W8LLJ6_MAGGI
MQLFGDGVSRQMNYVIDENKTIGHDGILPNGVISMLNHTLTENGFEERKCFLNADNCSDSGFARIRKLSCPFQSGD